jgi:hypothetical protein
VYFRFQKPAFEAQSLGQRRPLRTELSVIGGMTGIAADFGGVFGAFFWADVPWPYLDAAAHSAIGTGGFDGFIH